MHIRIYTTEDSDETRGRYAVCTSYTGPNDALCLGTTRRVFLVGGMTIEHAAAQARREALADITHAASIHLKEPVTIELFQLLNAEG